MPDSLKQKAASGVSWSFVEQFAVRGFNFIIGIILARLLSPSDYGLVGMIGIFMAISQLFIDGGFANALIQCKNLEEKDISTVYFINIVLSLFFFSLLYLGAPLIANFYHQPVLKSITRYFALTLVIGSIASVHGVLLTIKVDFKTKTYISTISAVLTGLIGVFCAYRGMGVWALVVQTVSSSAITTIVTLLFVRWMPKLFFSLESFKKLFSFGSKLLVANLISTIYANIYPLIIGKRYSPTEAGQFSRAGQFPSLCSTAIGSVLNRVAFPILSRIQDDDERLISIYKKYIQFSSFIIFPAILGLCGCARPLISLLLTDKWIECVPLMQILCFAYLFDGIILINLNLLYVKGRSDLVLRLEIIKKSIAFAILFVTAFFSIKIMCLGRVLYALIALFLNTYYTKKILHFSLWDQIKTISPYFIISLVILTEALAANAFIQENRITLLTSFVICPLTYYLLAKKLKLYAFSETSNYIKTMISIHFKK